MSTPTAPKTGESTRVSVCNPELIYRPAALEFVRRQRSTIRHCQSVAGLFAADPHTDRRERWKIIQGKLLVCDDFESALATMPSVQVPSPVPSLPPAPVPYLVGEKPILEFLLRRLDAMTRVFQGCNAAANDPICACPDIAREQAMATGGAVEELKFLVRVIEEQFSGSAEEQPETREKGAGVIGQPCDTPAPSRGLPAIDESAADFWAECASISDIEALSEVLLSELDRRGLSARWQAIS